MSDPQTPADPETPAEEVPAEQVPDEQPAPGEGTTSDEGPREY
jgi:hypothetical protein